MIEYELMTKEERFARIGHYLSKAVTLYVAAERAAGREIVPPKIVRKRVKRAEDDWILRGIVNYMRRFGWSTPREMFRHLDVHKNTFLRRLNVLLKRGMLEKRGLTSRTEYRLKDIAV